MSEYFTAIVGVILGYTAYLIAYSVRDNFPDTFGDFLLRIGFIGLLGGAAFCLLRF